MKTNMDFLTIFSSKTVRPKTEKFLNNLFQGLSTKRGKRTKREIRQKKCIFKKIDFKDCFTDKSGFQGISEQKTRNLRKKCFEEYQTRKYGFKRYSNEQTWMFLIIFF